MQEASSSTQRMNNERVSHTRRSIHSVHSQSYTYSLSPTHTLVVSNTGIVCCCCTPRCLPPRTIPAPPTNNISQPFAPPHSLPRICLFRLSHLPSPIIFSHLFLDCHRLVEQFRWPTTNVMSTLWERECKATIKQFDDDNLCASTWNSDRRLSVFDVHFRLTKCTYTSLSIILNDA